MFTACGGVELILQPDLGKFTRVSKSCKCLDGERKEASLDSPAVDGFHRPAAACVSM